MQKTTLYKDADFMELIDGFETNPGNTENSFDFRLSEISSQLEKSIICLESKDSFIQLDADSEEDSNDLVFFSILDKKKALDYEFFYSVGEEAKRFDTLENMPYRDDNKDKDFKPEELDNMKKNFETTVNQICDNDFDKGIGKALIIEKTEPKIMEKTLQKLEKKNEGEFFITYGKEGFSNIYVQNALNKIIIFEVNSDKPSLLNEVEKNLKNEYKKSSTLRP